jgi:hypothetical protein
MDSTGMGLYAKYVIQVVQNAKILNVFAMIRRFNLDLSALIVILFVRDVQGRLKKTVFA